MVQSETIFTFLCPVFVTGGTEAIHQASMAFNQLGAKSQIAYYGQGAQLSRVGEKLVCMSVGRNICLEAFAAYAPVVAVEVDLDDRNVLVVPEINALEYTNFLPARFAVWWLSVDNAIAHNPSLLEQTTRAALFANDKVQHWFQSEYARRFLLECGARDVWRLTDFTDDTFTSRPSPHPNQGSKILYNRKKGADLAERFFALNPSLEPVALDGMSKSELAEAYSAQALYVDFGSLPGKDRMPREAAACGCVVFVHAKGAGRELGDFPFADVFRFETNDIETGRLALRLAAALGDRQPFWDMQAHFRNVVLRERLSFLQEAEWMLGAQAHKRAAMPESGSLTPPRENRPVAVPSIEGAPIPLAFSEGWEAARDRYCLWCVTPDNYVHVHAFDEIMAVVEEAFSALGGSAPIVRDPTAWAGRVPIVFGGHLLSEEAGMQLPAGSIIFNLEQIDANSTWLTSAYRMVLGTFAVLDYSRKNTAALVALGLSHVRHLPIGSMPGMRRIIPAPEPDIDVLFYGSMNDRRAKILNALQARGLIVKHLFGVYGSRRDAEIARAKIVLNLHYYESAIFEIARVSYLMTNGCCVVTEGDEHDPDLEGIIGGLTVCGYDAIVETCVELLPDRHRREAIAARGRRLIDARRQSDLLAGLFAESTSDIARAIA